MIKAGQLRRCQGLDKLGRHAMAMRNPHNVFSSFAFQKTVVLLRNEIRLCEKTLKFLLLFSQLCNG